MNVTLYCEIRLNVMRLKANEKKYCGHNKINVVSLKTKNPSATVNEKAFWVQLDLDHWIFHNFFMVLTSIVIKQGHSEITQ